MSATLVLESDADDRLSEIFAALAHPTRRAILGRLAQGEASVGELAEPFEMSMPAVSRHIRVLEKAGLVQQGRRAQYRPCTLDTSPLAEVTEWTEQVREVWETSFDRLDDYVRRIRNQPPQKEKKQ
ncbi:MAG: metalloregulator ArsR/SmtB family transcription factor [Actinomycetota bacterium]